MLEFNDRVRILQEYISDVDMSILLICKSHILGTYREIVLHPNMPFRLAVLGFSIRAL